MTAVPIDHSYRLRAEPIARRTLQPVRRGSKPVQRDWFRYFGPKEGSRLILALEIHAEKLRRKGQRTGAAPRGPGDLGGISFGAVRLARLMVRVAVKYRGRLEPRAEWFAEKLNVALKSIHAWKAQLKRHGFLNWQRRYVETGSDGIRGPQVKQTSNAYWLRTPEAAGAAADRCKGPRDNAGDRAERLARLDPALSASLASLGNAVQDSAVGGQCRNPPT